MDIGKKLVSLLRCLDDEMCFVYIGPMSVVCHPAGDITETVTWLFKGKISVCYRYIYVYFGAFCV